MSQVTYLFKNRFNHSDVFKGLYYEMVKRGFNCIRIIDEDMTNEQINVALNSITGNVTILAADHLNDGIPSVTDLVKRFNPINKFYAMHDVGVHRIDDIVSDWHCLLPHPCWDPLFSGICKSISHVGHGKFMVAKRTNIHDIIWFPSLLYVYAEHHPKFWLRDFKSILDTGAKLKFPRWTPAEPIMLAALENGYKLLPSNDESFDYLLQCRTAIANAASSIGIEAAMAGCNSINIGAKYGPALTYDRFNVCSIDVPGMLTNAILDKAQQPLMADMVFDIDKCIDIVTKS